MTLQDQYKQIQEGKGNKNHFTCFLNMLTTITRLRKQLIY